ncbi:hypothetical protein EW145_g1165 [Phellinidium pouzarii]|uniref:Uncharacterized protein n=1 Tax=Phellinidium pouzarii TaxID=167371 RepID=A0A4S4LHB2_9AGAM|nr:hypothetical protein EW145_g1165 [Phellinidium pouzarii]
MPALTKEQIRHEVINLSKTLKFLERSVNEEDWARYTATDRSNKWLKAQSVLAGVNHCRNVLRNVTPADYDFAIGDSRSMSGNQFHDNAKVLLDNLERIVIDINQDLKPWRRRLNPILPTLPMPSEESIEASKARETSDQAPAYSMDEPLVPVDESELKNEVDLLPVDLLEFPLSGGPQTGSRTSRSLTPASTLLPSLLPSTSDLSDARSSNVIPGFLQTSTALQEDLSSQLAQMARQLKINAQHFSETLGKDQVGIQSAQEKLEQNYDDLSKERVRLRDHRGKSGSTTCLVLLSILVVIVGFVSTFFIIRVT